MQGALGTGKAAEENPVIMIEFFIKKFYPNDRILVFHYKNQRFYKEIKILSS